MSDEKRTTTIEDSAEQAEKLELEAKAEPDQGSYTHVFKEPFSYGGVTYEKLTFDWTKLSGRDSIAIERELRGQGVTTVMAEFTPEYLTAMAVRACTYRNEEGFRTVTTETLYALPLPEFRRICDAARRFLLRSGWAAAATGSENNV